jgi:hypothetical protein
MLARIPPGGNIESGALIGFRAVAQREYSKMPTIVVPAGSFSNR